MPGLLLGSGSLSDIEKQYPYYKWPDTLKYYYLGTMGFHLYSLIHHASHKARNDFMEMTLHHGSTLFLYFLSYSINRVEAGAIIMFLHDWADIPCSFVRCFTETTFVFPALISAIGMVILWFYTRLIVFPMIIYSTFHDLYEGSFLFSLYFSHIMLICLLILHYYWFYVLILSFSKYIKKGQVVDLQ